MHVTMFLPDPGALNSGVRTFPATNDGFTPISQRPPLWLDCNIANIVCDMSRHDITQHVSVLLLGLLEMLC